MSRVVIPKHPSPLSPREIQADAPHMSQHELDMAHQTAALWYRSGPTRHEWVYPSPAIAPTATFLSGTLTPYFVGTQSETAMFPWCAHPAAGKIEADVYFACFHDAPIQLRLESLAMADAITAKQGAYAPSVANVKSLSLPAGPWASYADYYGYSVLKRVRLELMPTIPSSRRFALAIKGQISAWSSSVSGGDETQIVARIYAIMARDILKGPT
jgi:hypothetical protein